MGWRRDGHGREFATRIDESLLHFGKFKAEEGGAGGQHKVEAGGYESLVMAVDFTEAAFGPVAMNGVTHGSTGGDHPYARRSGGRCGGAHPPSQEKGPAVDATALLTNGAEIAVAPEPLHGAQVHFKRP